MTTSLTRSLCAVVWFCVLAAGECSSRSYCYNVYLAWFVWKCINENVVSKITKSHTVTKISCINYKREPWLVEVRWAKESTWLEIIQMLKNRRQCFLKIICLFVPCIYNSCINTACWQLIPLIYNVWARVLCNNCPSIFSTVSFIAFYFNSIT